MFRSVRVGRAFGIPVYIHPTFLLLPALVLFTHPEAGPVTLLFLLLAVLAMFGCVLLHELGHALTARRFGIGTRDITLYPIGGVARLEGMGEKPAQELLIAVAGPAVNLVIALLLAPVGLLGLFHMAGDGLTFNLDMGVASLAVRFLTLVWVSNIGLVLFNLLPCFPMDGGRVLRALLTLGLGRLRATEVAVGVGLVLAVLIGIAGPLMGNPMTVVLAVFVVFAGQMELAAIRWREGRRPAARPALQGVPSGGPLTIRSEGPAPTALNANFSGLTWHAESGVWVQWRNGLPVAVWGPPAPSRM
jgi:Zn-dependent protease